MVDNNPGVHYLEGMKNELLADLGAHICLLAIVALVILTIGALS